MVKLISKDKFGNRIKWTNGKVLNGAISTYIYEIGRKFYGNHYNRLTRVSRRLAECNDTIINGIDDNGQEFLYRTNSCHSKWCYQCSVRKYLKMYSLANTYFKPLIYGNDDYFQIITVDGLNADDPSDFHHQIKLLKNAFQHVKKLVRYRKHCDTAFMVASPKPIDYGDGSVDVLPHLHIIMAYKKSFFNGRNYIRTSVDRYNAQKGTTGMNKYNQRKDWAHYLGYYPDIHVDNITDENKTARLFNVCQRFKYDVRPIGSPNVAGALDPNENVLIKDNYNNPSQADKRNYKVINILINGMYYVRRFSFSGLIRKIRSRVIHGKHHAKHARPRFIRIYGWLAGYHGHELNRTIDRLTGTVMTE